MAKRNVHEIKPAPSAVEATSAAAEPGAVEQRLTAYAEALGTTLGNLRGRVDDWTKQRAHLIEQLSTLVKDAQSMLADLGHATSETVSTLRRGRKPKRFVPPDSNPAGALKKEKRSASTSAARVATAAADKPRRAGYSRKAPNPLTRD